MLPKNLISICIDFILWANHILVFKLKIIAVKVILVPYKTTNTNFIHWIEYGKHLELINKIMVYRLLRTNLIIKILKCTMLHV